MVVELNIADDTVGYVFENVMNQKGVNIVKEMVLSKLEHYNNINLYLEEDDVDEIRMIAFFDQVFFDIKHSSNIRKIAVVTNRDWIQGIASIKDMLTPCQVESFDLKNRVDALCWIMK